VKKQKSMRRKLPLPEVPIINGDIDIDALMENDNTE